MSEDRRQLRLLPAVERVLNLPEVQSHCSRFGRSTVTDWIRQTLSAMRNGGCDQIPSTTGEAESQVVQRLGELASRAANQSLQQVINATGIVIHTNLGRAPLAPAAVQAMIAASACTNLELDLTTGQRGRRGAAVESLCQELTGAEAALVVNNCAAATLLTLHTIADGRRVVISRGQLIEIGGSFRLPDVFQEAGVELHEVGTTNRTRISDYEKAIGPETRALMRVHPSNYRISGFTESVSAAELAKVAKAHNIPFIDDVGSGALHDMRRFGLADEPVVSECVRAGADLVLFSGDKLLGGPQCGIIVGRADLVERLRTNPLARALRIDKLTFAALQATLEIHRSGRAFKEIPVLRQLAMSRDEIKTRAERLVQHLGVTSGLPDLFSVQAVDSASGGGSLAGQSIPSWAIAIASSRSEQIAERLRLGSPAVVARVQDGRNLIDLRTVLPGDEAVLCGRLLESLK